MLSMLLGHINQVPRNTASVQRSLHNALLVSNERVHGSVGGLTRINIQNSASSYE